MEVIDALEKRLNHVKSEILEKKQLDKSDKVALDLIETELSRIYGLSKENQKEENNEGKRSYTRRYSKK